MKEVQQELIVNYKTYIGLTDPVKLKDYFNALLSECEFEVIGFQEHFFTPQGYTAIWLLAESHLAIHTFPENESTYIELSSCNVAKNEKFESILSKGDLNGGFQ